MNSPVELPVGPRVRVGDNRRDGGCCACDRHLVLSPPAVVPHTVVVVKLLRQDFRLCPACADSLARQLAGLPVMPRVTKRQMLDERRRRMTGAVGGAAR